MLGEALRLPASTQASFNSGLASHGLGCPVVQAQWGMAEAPLEWNVSSLSSTQIQHAGNIRTCVWHKNWECSKDLRCRDKVLRQEMCCNILGTFW